MTAPGVKLYMFIVGERLVEQDYYSPEFAADHAEELAKLNRNQVVYVAEKVMWRQLKTIQTTKMEGSNG